MEDTLYFRRRKSERAGWTGNLTGWLLDGDTISTVAVVTKIPSDCTVSTENTSTKVTVLRSGGTVGTKYRIKVKVTTQKEIAYIDIVDEVIAD